MTSLNDLKRWGEEYIKKEYKKDITLRIYYTTELNAVKANIQGEKESREYSVLLSGQLTLNKGGVKGVAHEIAHILQKEHNKEFKKEWKIIINFFKKKIKEKKEKC